MQNPTNSRDLAVKLYACTHSIDLVDAFELDDETLEPEPEPGDFWGELDDDRDANG